jgi:hypothetical protein
MAEARGHIRHCPLDAGLSAQIQRQRERLRADRFDLAQCCREIGGARCRNRNIESVTRQCQCGRGADAIGCAADEGDSFAHGYGHSWVL